MSGTQLNTGANSSTELQGLDANSQAATNRTTLNPKVPTEVQSTTKVQ
jgi:hypothetical protein